MLQPIDPIQTIIQWFIEFWVVWGQWILPFLELILVWIALIIVQDIITRFLRQRVVRGGIPPDAINGLVIAIRLLFLWFGIVVFAAFVPPLWSYAVTIVGSVSVIIGLAVGLAISLAMRNFVAGIYVMFSDPFDVGDYVRIGSNEGIVLEISLNYTKLRQIDGSITLIPNNNVMDSSVTNFRFKRKQKTPLKEEDTMEKTVEKQSLPHRILKVLSETMDTANLVQYTLNLKFPVTESPARYEKIFKAVCKRWKAKFEFEPVWALVSIDDIAFTYAFTIFVQNPHLLIEYRTAFICDIGQSVY
jgi:small-conductance mechanosensitive channel